MLFLSSNFTNTGSITPLPYAINVIHSTLDKLLDQADTHVIDISNIVCPYEGSLDIAISTPAKNKNIKLSGIFVITESITNSQSTYVIKNKIHSLFNIDGINNV